MSKEFLDHLYANYYKHIAEASALRKQKVFPDDNYSFKVHSAELRAAELACEEANNNIERYLETFSS